MGQVNEGAWFFELLDWSVTDGPIGLPVSDGNQKIGEDLPVSEGDVGNAEGLQVSDDIGNSERDRQLSHLNARSEQVLPGSTEKDLTGSSEGDLTGSSENDPTGSSENDPTGSSEDALTRSSEDALTRSSEDDITGSSEDDITGSSEVNVTGSSEEDPPIPDGTGRSETYLPVSDCNESSADDAAVVGLIKYVSPPQQSYRKRHIRKRARRALFDCYKCIPLPDCVPGIVSLLDCRSPVIVQRQAVRVLAEMSVMEKYHVEILKCPKVISTLMGFLSRRPGSVIRDYAALVLGNLNISYLSTDDPAVEELVRALVSLLFQDQNRDNQDQALRSLATLSSAFGSLQVLSKVPEAIPGFVRSLSNRDNPHGQECATLCLSNLAVSSLTNCIKIVESSKGLESLAELLCEDPRPTVIRHVTKIFSSLTKLLSKGTRVAFTVQERLAGTLTNLPTNFESQQLNKAGLRGALMGLQGLIQEDCSEVKADAMSALGNLTLFLQNTLKQAV